MSLHSLYRYETHMHTTEGSACARSSAKEMVQAYHEKGYAGIFITDHFFNGNCAVDRTLPWPEKVAQFCLGYENAKREGEKCGLSVFFGFEYCVQNADFLVYNLDKEWLIGHPDIDHWDPLRAFRTMRSEGAFIIHAHPFRERDYIDRILLFPREVDGVEVINGGQLQDSRMNVRADLYADMYGLPKTSGSDAHFHKDLQECGIAVPEKLSAPTDYLRHIQAGTLRFLRPELLQNISPFQNA